MIFISVSIQVLIFYRCYITMKPTKKPEGFKMTGIAIQQPIGDEQTLSTCVVCGTAAPQQREGVMYECEHCMNEHAD